MSDYIDREAAIDAICEHGTDLERNGITVLAVANHKQVTVDLLEQLPSANVEPVRHGRWEWIGGYGYQYRCSECIMCAERRTKYCPHCGAKMDEVLT